MTARCATADWAFTVRAILAKAPQLGRSEGPLSSQVRLLALLGSAAPLNVMLEALASYVEACTDGMKCSLLLSDAPGKVLKLGAAPTLPAAYLEAIGEVPIAVGYGSCGTAAAIREMVIVEDVERSELWSGYAQIAVSHGLRACWSVPIMADSRVLLGTLALYYRVPREPSSQELDLIQLAASLATFVILRARSEATLRTSEARLRVAVGGAHVGLWDFQIQGEGVWFDDWCEQMDIDPCSGPGWEDRWCGQIHPDDRERYRRADSDCMCAAADRYEVEYRIRTRAGRWRWLHERGSVGSRGADGRPLHYVGVCIDIQDRKTAELALQQSEERLRTLARLVKGHVFEGRLGPGRQIEFTWADEALLQLFGCSRAEVNRRGWHNFVDPRDRPAAARCLATIAEGATASIELRMVGSTGIRRWLRMAGEPVRDASLGSVIGLIGMAEEITDRKVLIEQMFESINREQRRIGNDLHDDIGQVLTGASLLLRGCHTSALRGASVTPEEISRVLDLVTSAIEGTRLLAHGLAPGTLDCGGLTSALENLADRARRWSGLDIAVFPSEAPLGTLDATTSDHLYRIVQEAITNIARHAKARRAEIATYVEDDALVIEVSDDGIGTPSRITNGFGLRTMRYRASAIGATLAIEEAPPKGTRVIVRLPISSSQVPVPGIAPAEHIAPL